MPHNNGCATRKFLRALINYIYAHDLDEHILGYLICGGDSAEWVGVGPMEDWAGDYSSPMQAAFREWLQDRYGDVGALREAWHDSGVDFDQDLVPSPAEQGDTDLFLFKEPQRRRRAIDHFQFLSHLVVSDIDYLCGVAKYTGPNMYELWQLLTLGDENWTIFSGMDEQSLFGAMVGTRANIGSTLNLMSGVYRKIREHYESGDLASANELQIRANRITLVLQDFGFGGALREAMRILGFDCGEPRLPVTPLPAESRQAFHEALAAVDFGQLSAM